MARQVFGRLALATTLATGLSACKTAESPQTSALRDDVVTGAATGPKLCAGFRGNGDYIFAHFASLARITEHFGPLDAMSGGSSGSVTQFIYESIVANPLVKECKDGPCTEAESAARIALMLKSLQSYLAYIGNSDEAVAFKQLAPIIAKVKEQGVDALIEAEKQEAAQALGKVLSSKDIVDVINPELITMLLSPTATPFHAKEVWAAITKFGDWSVAENTIFFRPGVVNFPGLARKIGRVGSFYAGYAPANKAGMQAFLSACAVPGVGKNWVDIVAMPAGPASCGNVYLSLLDSFQKTVKANEASFPSRIDDPIGKYMPALVMTSLLEGETAAKLYADARKRYLAGQPPDFKMEFDLIRIGYWGRSQDLATVGANAKGYTDHKTKKFLPLGEAKWSHALSFSPAEPGLARLLEMSPTRVSAGGWPDLHPVLVLKNLGCQNTLYVTRRGEESPFAIGVARHLGLTDDQRMAMYDLDQQQPQSAYMLSLAEADGVWCTDWNSFKNVQVAEMWDDSYNAPLEAKSAFLKNGAPGLTPYPNAQAQVNWRGCTPGAGPIPNQ